VETLRSWGIPVEWLPRERLPVAIEGAHGAILDPTAGQIDGVDLLRAMRPVLLDLGVGVFEGTPVTRVREGATCELETPGGTVRARAIVLATNAWTPQLGYFRDAIFPLFSHVLATERRPAAEWADRGWCGAAGFSDDLDRLAYGSMSARGEVVFGGGSNAAYGYLYGGRTEHPGPTDLAWHDIHGRLARYLPRVGEVPVAHRWTGPVALTLSRVCAMGVRGAHRNVYYALGYSGHGITLANLAGRVLADAYVGDDARWRGLPFYEPRLPWIPPEPLRWAGYHVYTRLTGRSPKRKTA
jgi:glycine/D-amino acid oxidase-like deaminating enzyme